MEEDGETLSIGFEINFQDSFGQLRNLDDLVGEVAANTFREFKKIEQASGGAINMGGAVAQMKAFGNAVSREMAAATRETRNAEAAGEAMARQLTRQTETFGKTAAEIRNMRAEQRALAAESRGLTELAGRIRGLNTEMVRLEANSIRGAAGIGQSRGAMAALAPQAQDMATQVSMGANVFSVLAIQGGQLAGQLTYAGGAVGKFANFMMGPWGLAITGATFVLGALTKGMFDSGEESGKLTLNLDIQKNSYSTLTRAVREYNETQRDSAALTRQATEEAKKQTLELIKLAKAQLAAAEAKYFDQGTTGKAADVKAALGYQIGVEERKLIELQKKLSEIEKGLANQAVEASMKKEVEITTRYGRQLNNLTAAYDAGKKSVAEYRAERERLLRLQEKELETYRAAKRETDRAGPSASAVATRDARVGDMVALIKELFPGARITSTTGGQHTKGSDHYAGRAIDFVPGGGMGQYTTAEVEQILKNAGVDIRRNRSGTQQLFGPGRSASKSGDHDDHFHLAWQGSPDTSKVDAQKAAALAEIKRAYDASVKAAQDYADAQLDEAAKTGLTAKELRLYADAAAMARAPTLALKLAISAAAGEREKSISAQSAKDFDANVMRPLRDELALYGLSGPARAAAALELEKTAFLAKNMGDGIEVATARWKEYYDAKKALIDKDSAAAREADNIRRMREEFDALIDSTRDAGDAIARSFGRVGGAVGDVIQVLTEYQKRQTAIETAVKSKNLTEAQGAQASARVQIQSYTALAGSAKGFFKAGSDGYRAMAAAEKAFALVQLANTAINVAAGAAKMFASLGPFAFPAVAAMIGVMAALGFSKGGGAAKAPDTNTGTGTVFGDPSAKSESITNAVNALRDVDVLMLNYSRQMAASLKTIESSIGGFANLLVRNAESINASGNVKTGFNSNATSTLAGIGMIIGGPIGAGIGAVLTKIPIVGDILKGLFGTKTTVVGSGLFGGPQSVGDILGGGFDASYYSDIQKKKKLFGITTSNKTSTQFSGADPTLENQFTLILKSFNEAILAAAGPLGTATSVIQNRLNKFVVDIGKIDLQGLTGAQIEEKLSAVFGAAADNMATAAFPFIAQFQKAGEGAFETLIRVASTVEAVSSSLDLLGENATAMGIAAKLGLADQFDSVSALTGAVDSYFQAFYTKEEQAAARTAQMAGVFQSLGIAMPSTLAGFRALVEAQDLNSAAGREVYATLLKLAPAFADLQTALDGAKSAADIASERADLQRQLLELNGDTAALRALQLAKLDASNRELQQQIWAIQDAQAAAKAADELRKAWQSVGDTIMDEVRRIRGLNEASGGNGFASLMGQFNAATNSARGGDMDAAKSLPQLSQALLAAAADAATSRQELDRIRAQIAASLEATNGLIGKMAGSPATTNAALLNAGAASQPSTAAVNDNGPDSLASRFDEMRDELAQLRADINSGNAAIASNTGAIKRKLEDVTSASGGDAIATVSAA